MPSFDVSPTWVRPSVTALVLFRGAATAWLSSAPTFAPSGVSDVSVNDVEVSSDVLASALVTYGSATGVVTWTETVSGATVNQIVGNGRPKFVRRRPF